MFAWLKNRNYIIMYLTINIIFGGGFVNYLGESFAFATAVSWAVSSIIFETATKKTDSISVNVLRLFSGIIFLGIITFFTKGLFFPIDASKNNWTFLGISGVIGLFFGDIFLYEAYFLIGARLSMLFLTLTPLIVGFFGFLFLGETLTLLQITAMLITCSGILLVVIKPKNKNLDANERRLTPKGTLFVCIAVTLEALGNIFTKMGSQNYNATSSTQIRMICALFVFLFYLTFTKHWGKIINTVKDVKVSFLIFAGTVVSTLGITFLVVAFNKINTGVASTISSMSPVIIIPISIMVFKEKVKLKEIIGAIISVMGIALFFLK